MKKVLIYMQEGVLAKTGGPIGYNYALKSQLDKMGVQNIHYLPGGAPFKPGLGKKLKNSWYGNVLKSVKDFFRWTKAMYFASEKPTVDLNDYDIVHFHSCFSMYSVRKSLANYKGKVLLTSHSPRVSYQELMGMLTPWGQKHLAWYYKKMVRFDQYAFNRADYVVFPCEDAEEPYFNTWPEFEKIKNKKKDDFRYVLTGTYQCSPKLSKKEVCDKYGIPEDAFIVCYVGRHNDVKGYDQLKLIGEKLLEQNEKLYFLNAGEEYPLKGLDHPRWKEVGWTNDPHSIIAAADVFVLPNKETYFDLIMLEVLSLGKIVVASHTGGNKFFVDKAGKGILTYKDRDEAVASILDIARLSNQEKDALEQNNREFFNKNFSLEIFANNYVKLYESL